MNAAGNKAAVKELLTFNGYVGPHPLLVGECLGINRRVEDNRQAFGKALVILDQPARASRIEPRRVCRRLISFSYAAMGSFSRAA